MAEVGTYYVTIMPDMSQFTGSITSALSGAGTKSGNSYNRGFLDVVRGSAIGVALGNLATAAGNRIVGGLQTGIDRADTLRNFPRVMEAMGYNADEAGIKINYIMERLRGLPASTQDVVRLTQAIADSTGDLDLAAEGALAFTDAMIAQGASAGEVTQAQGVLNRILGKGNATVAQWQSLQSVMTPQMAAVAKELLGESGSVEELRDKLNDGTISWNDWLEAMVRLDNEGSGKMASFYEQAKANSDGIGTAIQNLSWRIGTGWANIINAIGVENISGPINRISDFISDRMTRVGEGFKYLKEQIGKTKIGENLGRIFSAIGDALGRIDPNEIKAVADAVIGFVDGALQWIVDHGDLVSSLLAGIGTGILLVGGFMETLHLATWLGLLQGTPGVIQAVWAAISANPFVALAGVVAAAVGALVYFFTQTETGQAIWQGFCQVLSDLWEGLQRDFNNLVETVRQRLEENAVQWEVFKGNVKGVIDAVTGFFSDLWGDFEDMAARIRQNLEDNAVQWRQFKENVSKAIESLRNTLANIWGEIVAVAKHEWEAISGAVGIIADGIRTRVSNTIENLKTNVSETTGRIRDAVTNAFTRAKDKALEVFDSLKKGVSDKIEAARKKVSEVVDRIKGLFNFSWSLPAPKLPHISWSWTDVAGIVSIPSFSVDWYAKGGVFDTASVIGIGEKGREAALPLNRQTYREIAQGIEAERGGGPSVLVTGNNFYVREEGDIDRIADALARRTDRERKARGWAAQQSYMTA